MSFLKGNKRYVIVQLMFVLSSLVLLQACNIDKVLEKMVSEEKLSSAKGEIEFILTADYQSVEDKLTEDIKGQLNPNVLNEFRALVPKEAPLSVSLVGYHQNNFRSAEISRTVENYSFQYEFSNNRWAVMSLNLQSESGSKTLIGGFHFTPVKGDLKELNKFSFAGQPLQNYIAVIFAALVPVFIIISLFMCYKTPIPKRKWLWYVFIALGFCVFNLNWTTGQWGIQFLAVQLLGSGFLRASMYAPVVIKTSIPLGAIIFHLRRKKWEK